MKIMMKSRNIIIPWWKNDLGTQSIGTDLIKFKSSDNLTIILNKANIIRENIWKNSWLWKNFESINQENLQEHILWFFIEKLIKEKIISSEYFLISQYISSIIIKLILWGIEIYSYWFDTIKQWLPSSFQNTWDIYLSKYIFWRDQKKWQQLKREEYLNLASWMYLTAYQKKQNEICCYLAFELHNLNMIIWLKDIINKLFVIKENKLILIQNN